MSYHDIFKKMADEYYSNNAVLLKRMGNIWPLMAAPPPQTTGMRTGKIHPVRLAYVLKKNIADCATYTNSNYAGIYYYIEKVCATFPKGVNRESVFNLPTDLLYKLLTEINSHGGAFVGFLFEQNDVGVLSSVKKTTKLMNLRCFQPMLRCWCEDPSGNEFVYDHLAENEQDMKAENLWPSSLDALVGIIAQKDYSAIGRSSTPGVTSPNIQIYIDPYTDSTSKMTHNSTKLEDAALVVCKYGRDFTISSEKAAEKIIAELVTKEFTPEWKDVMIPKVQEEIKKYRNRLGLEDTTRNILSLIDHDPYVDLSGILNGIGNLKFNYQPISSAGGIGSGQIPMPINRGVIAHKIGDVVQNNNTLSPLPDNTWLWCDGAYVYQDKYPDLYQLLQFNTSFNLMWGYVFDEAIEPFTNRTKFMIPLIPLNMIKAL